MEGQRSQITGARRRLSAAFEEDCISCALCGGQHSHFFTSSSWKSREACLLVFSLQVLTVMYVGSAETTWVGSLKIQRMFLGGGEKQTECVVLIIVGKYILSQVI